MSGTLGFKEVDEHIARSPVARAIARRRIELAARDFRLRLYFIEEGTIISELDRAVVELVLRVAARVASAPPEITEGVRALGRLRATGFAWNPAEAPVLDAALVAVVTLYSTAKATELNAAYKAEMTKQHKGTR